MFLRHVAESGKRKLERLGFQASVDGFKLKVQLPNMVTSLNISSGESMSKKIDRLEAMFKPMEEIYKEPSDRSLRGYMNVEEKLPEKWSDTILPSKRKVNVDALKQWARTVLFSGMTNKDLTNEYNANTGRMSTTNLTNKQKEYLIDSIAYKVSRKIWYVGRKPATLTDHSWDLMTKHMRPPEGSYGGGDKWKNFPYTQGYKYTSGVYGSGESPTASLGYGANI